MTAPLHLAMTGETDLTLTRQFAAPPRTLWRALTEPGASHALAMGAGLADGPVRHGPARGRQLPLGLADRPRPADGRLGRFLTVEAPTRLIHTEVFDEDWTGGETTVTQTLDEIAPNRTLLTMQIRYSSAAARQSAADSGMVPGMEEAYAKLDFLLADGLA